MCELGERLRQAREEKGLSLKEAAARLALKVSVLEALEACRFEDLPEPALVRGYLRRYALLLGLDPEPLLALYPITSSPPPPPPPASRRPWPWLLGLALALLGVLGYGAYLVLRAPPVQTVSLPPEPPPKSPERFSLQVTSDPPGARVYLDGFYLGQTPLQSPPLEGGRRVIRLELPGYEPLQEEVVLDRPRALSYRLSPKPQPAPAPTPASAPSGRLLLRLEGRSWLRVTQGEKRLYEGIPEVGAELSFDLPVEVRSGNPGAVRVFLDGQDLGPLGEPGKPLTRRFEAP
ncbi:RodZ domain-containing protein [Thermus amyloliquefaciens]|uniref:RodZ domain-containing protein n=1 Tax=Thermus amyloliquefaciens TaxID=1449080 RepID=UPI00056F6CE6|nr:RodZ domain-containing protein [Thermus amyloliquefaciens]